MGSFLLHGFTGPSCPTASLLLPQPTQMGHGSPHDKDLGNFVPALGPAGNAPSKRKLWHHLHYGVLQDGLVYVKLFNSWPHVQMELNPSCSGDCPAQGHTQAIALERGREGLPLGIFVWMALVRKAERNLETKEKMGIAQTRTGRCDISKSRFLTECCLKQVCGWKRRCPLLLFDSAFQQEFLVSV